MSAPADDNLSDVFRLLGDEAGMAPDALGVAAMTHAVRRQMVALGIASLQEYCVRLAAEPAAMAEVVEDLSVPETWFFRDPSAFACLARRLAHTHRPFSRPLRVLSAGCSTGEEAYSLAIALREAGVEPADSRVLGVDLSRAALAAAAVGRYSARSFREATVAAVWPDWRPRWCRPVEDDWQVIDALREGMEFRRANLAKRDFLSEEPPFDVIFCRNVLIYFRDDARTVALDNLRRLLSPDGLVCAASAEARLLSDAGFARFGGEYPFAFTHATVAAPVKPRAAPPQDCVRPSRRPAPKATAPARPRAPKNAVGPQSVSQPSAATAVAPPASREAMLRAAEEAADQQHFEEADELCGRILADDLACVEAHYLRGVLRQAQGQLPEAHRSWEKALYLDPRHYRSLVHMMLLAEQRGDRAAAANYRRRIDEVVAGDSQ
jgi:chemotaxis protein methyltransferase WspC